MILLYIIWLYSLNSKQFLASNTRHTEQRIPHLPVEWPVPRMDKASAPDIGGCPSIRLISFPTLETLSQVCFFSKSRSMYSMLDREPNQEIIRIFCCERELFINHTTSMA